LCCIIIDTHIQNGPADCSALWPTTGSLLMNVLFVGATGIVGRQVVPVLKEHHNLTLAALGRGETAGLPVVDIDITDFEAVEALIAAGTADGEPFDAVVNCAIADHSKRDMKNPDVKLHYFEHCIEVNARGAYHLYEASARAQVQRVVYISSLTAVLGPPRRTVIDESTRDQPNDVYAACKVFGEHVGRYYAYRPEAEGRSLRVFGLRLGQPYKSFDHRDDEWTHRRRRGLPTHADDIAQAILRSLEIDIQYGVYPIVSASDTPMIDPKAYAELGYKPGWIFTSEGIFPTNEESTPKQPDIGSVHTPLVAVA
jgi:nucleoside-diphosphate-sugar epimerase